MWALISNGAAHELADIDPAGRYNPGLQWVAAPAGTAVGDRWDGSAFSKPPAPTAADRLAALAAERFARETAGVMFRAAGAAAAALVASDRAAQGQIGSAYQLARDGHWVDGAPWKMADGAFVAMTGVDVQAMAVKVGVYVGACFAHEAQLAAALAADPAADITQGWPVNT